MLSVALEPMLSVSTGLGIALLQGDGMDARGRWSDDVVHTLRDRHLFGCLDI